MMRGRSPTPPNDIPKSAPSPSSYEIVRAAMIREYEKVKREQRRVRRRHKLKLRDLQRRFGLAPEQSASRTTERQAQHMARTERAHSQSSQGSSLSTVSDADTPMMGTEHDSSGSTWPTSPVTSHVSNDELNVGTEVTYDDSQDAVNIRYEESIVDAVSPVVPSSTPAPQHRQQQAWCAAPNARTTGLSPYSDTVQPAFANPMPNAPQGTTVLNSVQAPNGMSLTMSTTQARKDASALRRRVRRKRNKHSRKQRKEDRHDTLPQTPVVSGLVPAATLLVPPPVI